MSGKRHLIAAVALVLCASFAAAALSALLVSAHCARLQYGLLGAVCARAVEREPQAQRALSAALKACAQENPEERLESGALTAWGYRASDFAGPAYKRIVAFAAAGGLAGASLGLFALFCRRRAENKKIRELTAYLAQARQGKAGILSALGEDDFSKLEDEIYKTVTSLHQTKEEAVRVRDGFAQNLSHIAHQIKTPVTAISLAVQRMEGEPEAARQVEGQLARLTNLTEALLLLARLDAGALRLEPEETDVFTLLTLAADGLQELFSASGASVIIPEMGEMLISADMDWTMEAVMNVMKNCLEHGGSAAVHCAYAQNPLYTEILIWDEGKGFAKEELPHLFERFYRGPNARGGGVGLGLALAKEIIERQNGTIRALNRPEGGALFEIRFYSH